MAHCDELLALKARMEALPLRFGADYAAVYDSTMARFWFFKPEALELITDRLKQVPQGRILTDEELEQLNCWFPDRYFREWIFLMNKRVLIFPTPFADRPIPPTPRIHPLN